MFGIEIHGHLSGYIVCFRPSFMNDYEKFENELNEIYSNYVLKFRILSYLEKELEGHFRNQREKVQVNLNRKIFKSILFECMY